ncbi:hypothetical protein [Bernardetia sp.]|uniref:hypothetical protein n=1 Tax=Bernardetia sp. TaxID=1937974 RepID=UPI0025C21CAF|nr:hypothetical protein [Bernardetia sp.]
MIFDSKLSSLSISKDLTDLKEWEINFVEKKYFINYTIGVKDWQPLYFEISA